MGFQHCHFLIIHSQFVYWMCYGFLLSWQVFFIRAVHFSIQPGSSGKCQYNIYCLFIVIKRLKVWASFLLVCKKESRILGMHSGLSPSLCLCACVCVREGRSTVPYIKLSAPQLPSSSKWSLMAGGRFVSQFWIKSRVSQALGHCFCESSNSEDKDRCLSFCRRVFVCPCTLLCCVSLWTLYTSFTILFGILCGEYDAQPVSKPCHGV